MSQLIGFLKDGRQEFADILRKCSKSLKLDQGMQVHGAVFRMGYEVDRMINNDLIDMYGKCGRMDMARSVFDKMFERNVVSWTSLMCGFLQQGNARRALAVFKEMGFSDVNPNEFTLSTNVKACGILGVVDTGMQIHGLCCRSGFECYPVVGNSLLDMYARCGRIYEAAQVFEEMPYKSLISWNAMIAGYAHGEMGDKSLLLFQKMQKQGEIPDEYTLTSTLKACSGLGAFREGSQIHAFLIANGFPLLAKTIIAGALIDLYVKCGYLKQARALYNQVEQKSVISWTSLFLGYAQEANLLEAMDFFRELRSSNTRVDGFVLSSIVGVFADYALVEQGKQMHSYAAKVPADDISVANAIVDMYLKCGQIEEAEKLFNEMQVKNVVSWTVMITGYGKYGLGIEAVNLFKKMQLDGVEPDGVTYLALLAACSHSGLVEESREYFSRLCGDRHIKPKVEHYGCMVDILGRAGRLNEAKNLIKNIPFKPSTSIWQTLLSSCRVHGNLEMGREIERILLNLDGNNPVNYVMVSNLYADAGYWKESERLRKMVKRKGLKKDAGRSWIEIDKEVHFFFNRDETHPLTQKIHEVLQEAERRMKEEIGYASDVRYALRDVEEETKEESLRVHSEKLAIGLALLCGGMEKGGKPIRIFKNLRVCGDCHEFIKGLSKILSKVFVVRDANRFHKFEDGLCSCKDYW